MIKTIGKKSPNSMELKNMLSEWLSYGYLVMNYDLKNCKKYSGSSYLKKKKPHKINDLAGSQNY